jgi:acetolactate synthase regulatory subunit
MTIDEENVVKSLERLARMIRDGGTEIVEFDVHSGEDKTTLHVEVVARRRSEG